MERGIVYHDYEKISDDLCWIGYKCVLRMNVKLGSKGTDGTRYHFHKEFQYVSNYSDRPKLVSIRRSFEYFLSIEKTDIKESIMITIKDILLLRMKMNQVFKWFSDKTFAYKNKQMIILDKKKPIVIPVTGNKYIKFEPAVIVGQDERQIQGVRLSLNSDDVYADMTVDTYAGFLYIINTIDMYNAAQNMINYLGRPDFGTNIYKYESEYTEKSSDSKIMTGRQIPGLQPKKSYFDLDDM